MIRGTTPTLTFNLPFDTSVVKSAYLTIRCLGEEIEKSITDSELGETSISFTLTQEETLKLPKSRRAKIQLRILTKGGDALATTIYEVEVADVLKEGLIE